MTLFRYIFGRVATVFVFAFACVLLLVVLMDAVELLRRFSGRENVLGSLLVMAALHAPSVSMKALPFVMLLSAMWAYITLARSSELVAARAAGHSYWRQAVAGVLAAGSIGLVAAGLYAPLAAGALNAYERLEARHFGEGRSLLSVSGEGIWLREPTEEGFTVIQAARANADGTELYDAIFFRFSADDRLLERIDAERALLGAGVWSLSEVGRNLLGQGSGTSAPEITLQLSDTLPTRLTASEIQNSFAAPESISVWQLGTVIESMEAAGFSARRHIAHLHSLLSLPLFLGAMTLIAAAFAIRPPRSARFGWIALACALTGFGFYFLSDVSLALGASGATSPVLGAWAPAVGAVFLGVALSLVFGET